MIGGIWVVVQGHFATGGDGRGDRGGQHGLGFGRKRVGVLTVVECSNDIVCLCPETRALPFLFGQGVLFESLRDLLLGGDTAPQWIDGRRTTSHRVVPLPEEMTPAYHQAYNTTPTAGEAACARAPAPWHLLSKPW